MSPELRQLRNRGPGSLPDGLRSLCSGVFNGWMDCSNRPEFTGLTRLEFVLEAAGRARPAGKVIEVLDQVSSRIRSIALAAPGTIPTMSTLNSSHFDPPDGEIPCK